MVNPAEVVVRILECESGPVILDVLGGAREAGEVPNVHPHGEVLPLDLWFAYEFLLRIQR